jgi:hypothetical protein
MLSNIGPPRIATYILVIIAHMHSHTMKYVFHSLVSRPIHLFKPPVILFTSLLLSI